MTKDKIGELGEQYVARYYRRKGYKIISRNFKTRFGELDIVAEKRSVVVIIEVKTRVQNSLISAAQAVTKQKQSRIIAATKQYLVYSKKFERYIRFDVAEVFHNQKKVTGLNIIENAFM